MRKTVLAHGKINLFLDVLGKREDGYHEVAMIMQGVRIADVVDVSEAKRNSIFTDSPFVPNNEHNLAMKAARLLQTKYHLPPVAIRIVKNIPVSAGMAGGSTDAAAVLIAMNDLFQLKLQEDTLEALAAELGSDVPFCLKAETALASGRGETITSLASLPVIHLVLAKANFGVSTAAVYGAYSSVAPSKAERPLEDYLAAVEGGDVPFILRHLFNALEPVTFSMYPKVKEMKERFQEMGAEHVLMSGSGPTIFAAFEHQNEAWQFYKKARKSFASLHLTATRFGQ